MVAPQGNEPKPSHNISSVCSCFCLFTLDLIKLLEQEVGVIVIFKKNIGFQSF